MIQEKCVSVFRQDHAQNEKTSDGVTQLAARICVTM
jgi:hypothetical protein